MRENEKVESEIAEFYKDKSIFITGGSGFVGKSLIEKLLRSCSKLNKIYLLMRHKKGKQASERLDEIVDCKLFEKVSKMNPLFRDKLCVIEGDLVSPGLGISKKDRDLLIENVNIIFHSAATVRFDEPLRVAVEMNIIGVRKVIDLAKQMKNLNAFIHVSTAYANCDRIHISEEVYNPPVKPEKLIEAIEWMDNDLLNDLTPKVLKSRPNTYTYTKAIAEYLVVQECKNMPSAIIRPSIIGASWREPFSGWVDGWNGPTALFPAVGTGLLRSMLGNYEATADLIPVDVVVNLMIAIAWNTGTKKTNKTLVFNCTSGQINNVTWGRVQMYYTHSLFKNPFENICFVPHPYFTENKMVKTVRTFLEQLLPAYIFDFFMRLFKKKAFLVRVQDKIKKVVGILEFFTTHQWEFTNDNIFMLRDTMNSVDFKTFNFDVRELNWKSYIEQYCLGAKVYLMKEDINKLNKCRQKMQKLIRMEKITFGIVFIFILRIVLLKTNIGKNIIRLIFMMVSGAKKMLRLY